MSKDLKTLKEIYFDFPNSYNVTETVLGNRYIKSLMREEAKKWIELSDFDLYELGFDKSDNSTDLRKWIKHFFNLEDENAKS